MEKERGGIIYVMANVVFFWSPNQTIRINNSDDRLLTLQSYEIKIRQSLQSIKIKKIKWPIKIGHVIGHLHFLLVKGSPDSEGFG